VSAFFSIFGRGAVGMDVNGIMPGSMQDMARSAHRKMIANLGTLSPAFISHLLLRDDRS
jgi:hypothetical protein